VTADLERFEALFADPDYDGPELPPEEQPEPGSGSVWAIWAGGPIKAGADLSAARCTRWWREHPDGPPDPVLGDCGDGYAGPTVAGRTVETVAVAGGLL
jgi:hypothetical protein